MKNRENVKRVNKMVENNGKLSETVVDLRVRWWLE